MRKACGTNPIITTRAESLNASTGTPSVFCSAEQSTTKFRVRQAGMDRLSITSSGLSIFRYSFPRRQSRLVASLCAPSNSSDPEPHSVMRHDRGSSTCRRRYPSVAATRTAANSAAVLSLNNYGCFPKIVLESAGRWELYEPRKNPAPALACPPHRTCASPRRLRR